MDYNLIICNKNRPEWWQGDPPAASTTVCKIKIIVGRVEGDKAVLQA